MANISKIQLPSGTTYDITPSSNANANTNGIFFITSETGSTTSAVISDLDISSYYQGLKVVLYYTLTYTSNTAVTLNIGDLGARRIYKAGTTTLEQGFLKNSIHFLCYVGTAENGYFIESRYVNTDTNTLDYTNPVSGLLNGQTTTSTLLSGANIAGYEVVFIEQQQNAIMPIGSNETVVPDWGLAVYTALGISSGSEVAPNSLIQQGQVIPLNSIKVSTNKNAEPKNSEPKAPANLTYTPVYAWFTCDASGNIQSDSSYLHDDIPTAEDVSKGVANTFVYLGIAAGSVDRESLTVDSFNLDISNHDFITIKYDTTDGTKVIITYINGRAIGDSGGGGGNAKTFYGTCPTLAATAIKQVTCPDFTSADLVEGVTVIVKFIVTNSAAVSGLKLDVNSTGRYSIKKNTSDSLGGVISNLDYASELTANTVIPFIFNGTYWIVAGLDRNTNTTYSIMADTNLKNGNETTGRLVSARLLKDNFDIDTSNRTVTMRNDTLTVPDNSNLVHKTGAESIGGNKIFLDVISVDGQDNDGVSIGADNHIFAGGNLIGGGFVLQGATGHHDVKASTLSAESDRGVMKLEDQSASGNDKDIILRGVAAPTGNSDAVNKSYLATVISGLPSDSSVVHKTNSETITGYKTFTGGALFSNIEMNSGLNLCFLSSSVRNEIYMGNGVTENDVGVVEFSDADYGNGVILRGLHAPTSNGDAANKKYVDDIVGDIETLLAAI